MRATLLVAAALTAIAGCHDDGLTIDVPTGYSGPVVIVFGDPKGQSGQHIGIDQHGMAFVREPKRGAAFNIVQDGQRLTDDASKSVGYSYFTSGESSVWCEGNFAPIDYVAFTVGREPHLDAENRSMRLLSTAVMDQYMEDLGKGSEYQRAIQNDARCTLPRGFGLR
jgi:hypothetical protein